MVILRFTLQINHLNTRLNIFHILTPLRSNKFMMMKWTNYWNYSTQRMMNIFWMLTSICFRINQLFLLLQKIYKVSTVLFHKYQEANVAVTNGMPHFYMFVPTKANVKYDNGNKGHGQGIGIILYSFTNCTIIYPMGTVYYCPGHPSNTI